MRAVKAFKKKKHVKRVKKFSFSALGRDEKRRKRLHFKVNTIPAIDGLYGAFLDIVRVEFINFIVCNSCDGHSTR